MKTLLALLLIVALCVVVYAQMQKIKELNAGLETAQAQVESLQKANQELQTRQPGGQSPPAVRSPLAQPTAAQPAHPAAVQPTPESTPANWMWDSNHKGTALDMKPLQKKK